MMKGYWHFLALSVLLSILTVIFDNKVFFIILLIWLFYLHKQRKIKIGTLVTSLVFYIGFCSYIPIVDLPERDQLLVEGTINGQVTGTISSPVKINVKRIEFVLRGKDVSRKWVAVAFNPEESEWDPKTIEQLKYGATCQLTGLLEIPDKSRNPGQFDYQKYLRVKGITHQVTISSMKNISCNGQSPLNYIFETRLTIINFVISRTNPYTAKWLSALILGDDSQLDEETIDLFQKWNLSHLLAISGLNVAIIISITYFLLIKLNFFSKEKAQLIMLIILPFYALIAGGEPSVWRACLMVFVFIVVRKLNTIFTLTDVLSIIFIVMILYDKFIVYHVGFQLSFLVTLGLLLSGKWISATKSNLFISLQISFMAQMMIIPLQLAYFYTFQPLAILLNVFIIPYFSFFVIPIMFIILLLTPVSETFCTILGNIFESTNQLVINCIHKIDELAYFPYILGPMPIIVVVIYYVLFLFLMDALQNEKKRRAFQIGCLLVVIFTFVAVKPFFSPYGTVTMLDIGQGDCFIIELPFRKAVFFIDAGAKMSFENEEPTDANYKQIIKPYLYSKGISKIDALFLSHEDVDHVGSVSFLLKEFQVDEVLLSNYYNLADSTINSWKEKDTHVERINGGDELMLRGLPIGVLSPAEDRKETNSNSLVLYMKLGGLSWLFTGDIDKKAELQIKEKYATIKIDVLKVAHHGSNTSTDSSFVKKLRPKYAWISVGQNNSYGHPTTEVLDLLNIEGVKIFRTDQDGAVQFRYKDNKGRFSKFLP
ncbi:DNA internalization-related competence protein ComEC/Rec2 [Virgibacillus flavescens]|uniref:DNA internalization-related competence protein ComEC/Rec2 n=1 Tax=Virgibacillus flavescens TaxID=1611422 RepID=UPI003D33CD0D